MHNLTIMITNIDNLTRLIQKITYLVIVKKFNNQPTLVRTQFPNEFILKDDKQ